MSPGGMSAGEMRQKPRAGVIKGEPRGAVSGGGQREVKDGAAKRGRERGAGEGGGGRLSLTVSASDRM